MQRISGHEYSLSKIFSAEFEFSIPPYQRPYAWTTEEAGELFDDLMSFMQDQGDGGEDPYFLGSIVLIKADGKPDAEVIDGQQRLTTLTILLAALRDNCDSDQAEAIEKYINEPGDLVEAREPKPRLTPRERDTDFFKKYVQDRGGIKKLLSVDTAKLSDPQRNIRDNAALFVERLKSQTGEEAFAFARFIATRCYLVAVATPSMQSAYRIFSVMNDRGLDLLTCDILKSDIIGSIAENHREDYTTRWEEVEELLGRNAFNELFTHIRMIYMRFKARKSILDEFRSGVLESNPDGENLIAEVIEPYAETYEHICNANYQSAAHAEQINELLRWLNRIDNTDWVPPAIKFVSSHTNDAECVLTFLQKLERLAASLFIRRVVVGKRIERYAKVLEAIDEDTVLDADSPLMLSAEEQHETISYLDVDLYNSHTGVRSYVLLRLDSWLSDGAAMYDTKVITVEHVLPQTIDQESDWGRSWTQESRERWVHRLGNLVLLARKKNSQAQNFDFDKKKTKYFTDKGGVSSFTLTTQVLNQSSWTVDVVEKRHEELLEKLTKGWDLCSDPGGTS
ncbi:MAG: DUF262 domain-containing HNH endonuclease family protein [Phycisphaerales bacterium]